MAKNTVSLTSYDRYTIKVLNDAIARMEAKKPASSSNLSKDELKALNECNNWIKVFQNQKQKTTKLYAKNKKDPRVANLDASVRSVAKIYEVMGKTTVDKDKGPNGHFYENPKFWANTAGIVGAGCLLTGALGAGISKLVTTEAWTTTILPAITEAVSAMNPWGWVTVAGASAILITAAAVKIAKHVSAKKREKRAVQQELEDDMNKNSATNVSNLSASDFSAKFNQYVSEAESNPRVMATLQSIVTDPNVSTEVAQRAQDIIDQAEQNKINRKNTTDSKQRTKSLHTAMETEFKDNDLSKKISDYEAAKTEYEDFQNEEKTLNAKVRSVKLDDAKYKNGGDNMVCRALNDAFVNILNDIKAGKSMKDIEDYIKNHAFVDSPYDNLTAWRASDKTKYIDPAKKAALSYAEKLAGARKVVNPNKADTLDEFNSKNSAPPGTQQSTIKANLENVLKDIKSGTITNTSQISTNIMTGLIYSYLTADAKLYHKEALKCATDFFNAETRRKDPRSALTAAESNLDKSIEQIEDTAKANFSGSDFKNTTGTTRETIREKIINDFLKKKEAQRNAGPNQTWASY